MYKGMGGGGGLLCSFFLNILYMEMKQFGLDETKLFHFHRMFKNGGLGGGFK